MTLTVLQIIPRLGAGGAEQACFDVAAGLVARGDRALVVSDFGSRVDEVAKVGGEYMQIPAASKNPLQIWRNAKWLEELIRKEHIDIIHARSRAPAWSAWLAAKRTKCHYVTTFSCSLPFFRNKIKKAYNDVMARGERIIAISQFVAEHIHREYGVPEKRIRTIYRGIETEKFASEKVTPERQKVLRDAWNVTRHDRIILLPARLSPIKGHKLLIAAMAVEPLNSENVIAVIIGDDQGRVAYRQELTEQIEKKALGDRVRLVKHCSDMPAAYSLASVVAMPSYVPEGFGRVPVEAMAMGVPVVASSLGATIETVLEGVTGWLLPPHDPSQWAEALTNALHLSEEERAKMADAGQKIVREHFTRARHGG